MLKWFFAHDKAVLFSMGLILVLLTLVTSLLFPGWLYVIGAILIGYTLFSVAYFWGKEDVKKREAVRESNLLTSSECNMRTEKYLKKHMDNDLSAEKLLGNTSVPGKDWYTHVSEGWSSFCGCFFASPKPKTKTAMAEITEAAERCAQQIENHTRDKNIINEAVKRFNAESSDLQKKLDSHFPVTGQSDQSRIGEFKKEQGVKSREALSCSQLLDEFYELRETYPRVDFYENLSLEAIESYMEDREKHHEKVLALAEILLPDLFSLLNEGKELHRNLQMNASSSKII